MKVHLRTTTRHNKSGSVTYVQLATAKWDPEKKRSQTTVVANLGRADQIRKGDFDPLIQGLTRAYSRLQLLEEDQLELESTWREGPRRLVDLILKRLGVMEFLEKAGVSETQLHAIRLLILERIERPCSKRASQSGFRDAVRPGESVPSLSTVYRAMDSLLPEMKKLEDAMFRLQFKPDSQRDLFTPSEDLDIVFFDTTSVSVKVEVMDGPFARGYSKDHRPDLPQFLVGLVMTSNREPLAHYVFPGNLSDVDAFRQAITDVQKRFPIRRLIFCADTGCVGRNLLESLRKSGLEYIVTARLRNEKVVRDQVLSRPGRYRKCDESLSYKEVRLDERFVIVRNRELAAYEADTRAHVLKQLREMEGQSIKSLVRNSRYRRYLARSGEIRLDPKRIRYESRFDGKWVIRSNVEDMAPPDLIEAYKTLWHVESWFRKLKVSLRVRPVFHWTPDRVKAHVALCFLAMKVWAVFENALSAHNPDLSPTDAWRDVGQLRGCEVNLGETRAHMRTELTGDAPAAFQALQTQPPPRVKLLDTR